MDKSIVYITNESNTCLGTGFVIDKDLEGIYVATCGHVINNCKGKVFVEGKVSSVIKNEYSNGLDIGILYVSDLKIEPLELLDDNNSKNAVVIGYSKLLNSNKKEKIIDIEIKHNLEVVSQNRISVMKLITKEPISAGYSGSPVICPISNKVIGIIYVKEGENYNYAIYSKHISEIYDISLKKLDKSQPAKSHKIGIKSKIENTTFAIISSEFNKNFNNSLKSFAGQPKIWIKPRIYTKDESSNTLDKLNTQINIDDIINYPESIIIHAREQYGLTTLSHYLIKEAWNSSNPSLWIRLDTNELKQHTIAIRKTVDLKLEDLKLTMDDVEGIILDEFSANIKDVNKILAKTIELFIDKPIIILHTISNNPFLSEVVEIPLNKTFKSLYLWAMPRSDIRQVVIDYNNEKEIGEENAVLNKIVSDLEVLNIPRTALNCLTILKISEVSFDDSPVNRTEMLSRILSLLFNVEKIPRYKTRPDLKDTEYTLGYFCELMIKENNYYFTRKDFIDKLKNFCLNRELDLEVDIIFDVLNENNIIVERGNYFCFKFSYWVFYFSAKRMHQNSEFADYILKDMNYISYPELIEFYTGIERNRNKALEILTDDIKSICDIVEQKCGLPKEFNIYNMLEWKPSDNTIAQMNEELTTGVLNSKLPDIIKDEYADKNYCSNRPLNQSIHKIMEEYSLLKLIKSINASSKALRNSDYAEPKIKHYLLKEILRGWEQITKILLVFTPILAKEGAVTVDGASFILDDNFGKTTEEKVHNILSQIPGNVSDWFKDDLFSKKMSSLLFNHLNEEECRIKKHLLNLLLISKRPKKWDTYIEDYIIKENKNSFYLSDLYDNLRAEYQYSFASDLELKSIEKLLKIISTKHHLGIKSPSKKIINKLEKENRYKNIIPERSSEI